jgi:hypothetical protein
VLGNAALGSLPIRHICSPCVLRKMLERSLTVSVVPFFGHALTNATSLNVLFHGTWCACLSKGVGGA